MRRLTCALMVASACYSSPDAWALAFDEDATREQVAGKSDAEFRHFGDDAGGARTSQLFEPEISLTLLTDWLSIFEKPVRIEATAEGASYYAIGPLLNSAKDTVLTRNGQPARFHPFDGPVAQIEYFLDSEAAPPETIYVQFRSATRQVSPFVQTGTRIQPSVRFSRFTGIWAPTIDPLPDEISTNRNVTITGTRVRDDLDVKVRWRSTTLEGEDIVYGGPDGLAWSATFTDLPDDRHLFTAWCVGVYRGQLDKSSDVHTTTRIRTTPPWLSIDYPKEGAISNTSLVAGSVGSIATKVTVNGVSANLAEGVWWVEETLQAGVNEIEVIAAEGNGLTSTATRSFYYAPDDRSIFIAYPSPGSALKMLPISVTGTATANRTGPVIVAGQHADVDAATGAFTARNVMLFHSPAIVEASVRGVDRTLHTHAMILHLEPETEYFELRNVTEGLDDAWPAAGSPVNLAAQLIVNGEPKAGEVLRFEVLRSGATILDPEVVTDADGTATTAAIASRDLQENIFRVQAIDFPGRLVEIRFWVVPSVPATITLVADSLPATSFAGASIGLEATVADASGNTIDGVEISVASTGGYVANAKQGASVSSQFVGESDAEGALRILLRTSDLPRENTVTVSLVENPAIAKTFAVTTESNEAFPTVEQIRAAVAANDAKIDDIEYRMTQTLTIGDEVIVSERTVWEMGNLTRMEVNGRVHFSPTDEKVGDPTEVLEEKVASSPAANIYVVQTVLRRDDRVIIHEEWIDHSRGVVLREITYAPGLMQWASSFKRSHFESHSDHDGAWVPMRVESREEDVTIVNEVTEVLINQGLRPTFFHP